MSKEKSLRKQVEEKLTEKYGFWNISWNTLKMNYKDSSFSVIVSGKEVNQYFDGLFEKDCNLDNFEFTALSENDLKKIDDDIKDSSKKMFERLDSERKESLEAIKNRKASIEKNLKDLGLKRIELWIDPNDEAKIREFDKRHLREKKKSGKKSEK